MRDAGVFLVAIVLSPLLSAAQCGSAEHAAKDCSVAYAGLGVDHGRVVDTVTPTCDVRPQQHTIQVRLELEVGGEWLPQGRDVVRSTPPDKAGFAMRVSASCHEGVWHTMAYAAGTGPNGDPFQYRETGVSRHFGVVDCAS